VCIEREKTRSGREAERQCECMATDRKAQMAVELERERERQTDRQKNTNIKQTKGGRVTNRKIQMGEKQG
jgi:hypothetical protein